MLDTCNISCAMIYVYAINACLVFCYRLTHVEVGVLIYFCLCFHDQFDFKLTLLMKINAISTADINDRKYFCSLK